MKVIGMYPAREGHIYLSLYMLRQSVDGEAAAERKWQRRATRCEHPGPTLASRQGIVIHGIPAGIMYYTYYY